MIPHVQTIERLKPQNSSAIRLRHTIAGPGPGRKFRKVAKVKPQGQGTASMNRTSKIKKKPGSVGAAYKKVGGHQRTERALYNCVG